MMRAWMTMPLVLALGCTPPDVHDGCPADLPQVSDWGEGVVRSVVGVGSTVVMSFNPIAFEERCVVVDTTGPSGTFPVTVSPSRVEFMASSPGTWSVTVRHWSRVGRSYSQQVEAQTPPPALQPCVSLPRSCARVYDGQAHVTCDDTLYSRAGVPLRTLDGGAWFGSGDALFAWEAGLLRRISITDAGVEEVASAPSLLPRLWTVGAGRLAIGTDDGGVLFALAAQGLAPLGEFAVSPAHLALALTASGELILAASEVQDFACFVDGGCARDRYVPNAAPRLAAASDQGVYVLVQHTFFGTGDPLRFASNGVGGFSDSSWGSLLGTVSLPRAGDQVPRRPHVSTFWGMQVEGVEGVMSLPNAQRSSSTDGVVWSASATETAIWCAPR